MRPIGSRSVAELESRITDLSNECTQLRATLAQRTAALRMLLDWVEDEEECATLDSMIAQARQALTETPAT
jgi:uncharacterized coiled-coil protein SlyX